MLRDPFFAFLDLGFQSCDLAYVLSVSVSPEAPA
jgi:hypothetical protein